MKSIIDWVVVAFVVFFIGFALYTTFVWLPVSIYTEAKCLRQGYPNHAVSVGLEGYCMNLDGSVTVKVDHQGSK